MLRWGCALKRGRIAGSEGEMSSCLQRKGDLSVFFFFFFKSRIMLSKLPLYQGGTQRELCWAKRTIFVSQVQLAGDKKLINRCNSFQ